MLEVELTLVISECLFYLISGRIHGTVFQLLTMIC